ATVDDIVAVDPTAVVLAVGARPTPAPIPLPSGALTLLDALETDVEPAGRVVIYSVSDKIDVRSVADRFGAAGARVTLATPHGMVASGVDDATQPAILSRLAAHEVEVLPFVTLMSADDAVTVASIFDGRPKVLDR